MTTSEGGKSGVGRWRDSKNVKRILDRPVYRPPMPHMPTSRWSRRDRIEQAIALTGDVTAAFMHLAGQGEEVPYATVKKVYDAMDTE